MGMGWKEVMGMGGKGNHNVIPAHLYLVYAAAFNVMQHYTALL